MRWIVLKERRGLIFLGVLILGVAGTFVAPHLKPGVAQPIAFNHKLHTGDLKLECTHCHQGLEIGPFATLPSAEICLGCHANPLSENPEEAKVRNYGDEKGEIPWQRLTRQPDHVYFSHQRHVKLAGLECKRCHGTMQERTRPPRQAPMDLSMDDCLNCHREKGASEDCILCHR